MASDPVLETELMRVESKFFVAALLLHNGRVYDAAPILRYMLRWDMDEVEAYCRKRGWLLRVLR